MENIKIYDNFLSELDCDKCKKIIQQPTWKFGHTSQNNIINTPFWYMELIDNEYLKEKIKKKIEEKTNKTLIVNRLYANGQTYGQDGDFHQDDTEENTYTFCLYLTEIPDNIVELVGGQIEIFLPNSEHNINIKTLFNRGIFFPSHFFHRGTAYNRYVPDLRVCIAWKFKEVI
jgi:hypothetical protein